MAKKIDYAAFEHQDREDPAPAGHYWIRDIDGNNRRLVTAAQYIAEVKASKKAAMVALKG